MSTTQLEVLTSLPSDDGVNFAPVVSRRVVSFVQPLTFSRGYIHIIGNNHATWKYGITFGGLPRPLRSWNLYRDNIGVDGPAITWTREYEIRDALVPSTRTPTDGYPLGTFHTTVYNGHGLGCVNPNNEPR